VRIVGAARGWDLPGLHQTTGHWLKQSASQMWTHPSDKVSTLITSKECFNPLLDANLHHAEVFISIIVSTYIAQNNTIVIVIISLA